MELAVNDSPVRQLSAMVSLQRDAEPELAAHADELAAPAVSMLELLLQPDSIDRPRGDLLREVLEGVAPQDRKRLISDAVAWSRRAPESTW